MSSDPRDQAPLDPDFLPQDVRMIGDIESLRAISDPTRLRILETMVQRQDPAWSVKELATEIGVPPTRLYHHVELLLERDLIRPVERRVVSGIIETRYRVVAKSFQLDRGSSPATPRRAPGPPRHARDVFDTARKEIEESRSGAASSTPPTTPPPSAASSCRAASPGLARQGRQLRERIKALEDEVGEEPEPGADAYGSCSRSTQCRGPPKPAGGGETTSQPNPTATERTMTDQPAAAASASATCSDPTSGGSTSPRRSPTSATG